MNVENKHILLFDGVCNLCNGVVKFIIKQDTKGKFSFAPLQSSVGQQLLKTFGLNAEDFDSLVYIEGKKYYVKSSACLYVLKRLGGIWKFFFVFMLLPLSVRDFVYDCIARSRYTIFGRQNECMVPSPEIRKKFLV